MGSNLDRTIGAERINNDYLIGNISKTIETILNVMLLIEGDNTSANIRHRDPHLKINLTHV